MTIDLGYAYWPQPDGSSIGFIDVPGHEKFFKYVGWISGINHALLVVACDDGVMAQTLEHLSILRLAGCEKYQCYTDEADRVDHSRIEQVTNRVTSELAKQGWPDAKLFITSIEDGRGIDALRLYLQQLHQQSGSHPNIQRRFRLAIDRVFG